MTIGDSLLKDIKSYKMNNDIQPKGKSIIKSFPGATTACMGDYLRPSIKYNPDVVILHCGTNILRSNKDANVISNDIINLARQLKRMKMKL